MATPRRISLTTPELNMSISRVAPEAFLAPSRADVFAGAEKLRTISISSLLMVSQLRFSSSGFAFFTDVPLSAALSFALLPSF